MNKFHITQSPRHSHAKLVDSINIPERQHIVYLIKIYLLLLLLRRGTCRFVMHTHADANKNEQLQNKFLGQLQSKWRKYRLQAKKEATYIKKKTKINTRHAVTRCRKQQPLDENMNHQKGSFSSFILFFFCLKATNYSNANCAALLRTRASNQRITCGIQSRHDVPF